MAARYGVVVLMTTADLADDPVDVFACAGWDLSRGDVFARARPR
jgi:hypothetical protein